MLKKIAKKCMQHQKFQTQTISFVLVFIVSSTFTTVNPVTAQSYQQVIARCKKLFLQKTADYGTAWRIMRLPSITDQIYIKARRIRSIQEKGTQKINDNIESEFVGIINYAIIALMQIELQATLHPQELTVSEVETLYDRQVQQVFELLQNKNHDYDEAWRAMRVSSMTDIILMKLLRIKQIEDNAGQTHVSEGVAANYQDIMNYAVFCLIQLGWGA